MDLGRQISLEFCRRKTLSMKMIPVDLTPKSGLVAAETLEGAVVQIGEALKTARDLGVGFLRRLSGIGRIIRFAIISWCRRIACSILVPTEVVLGARH